jgi:hypothetical protein
MQENRIEPILAVNDHGGVFDVAMRGTPFAPVMTDIERMMQEERMEPIVAVEDHGGVFDVAMGSTPFAPVMTANNLYGNLKGIFSFIFLTSI